MDEITWKDLKATGTQMQTGKGVQPSAAKEGFSFQDFLKDSLQEVNDLQNEADAAIRQLAQGKTQDIHRTMVMVEKADLSFQLMMKVRNKLLEAYHEMMRMQV
jgi:flagellar hook-basal body complex protein FliE